MDGGISPWQTVTISRGRTEAGFAVTSKLPQSRSILSRINSGYPGIQRSFHANCNVGNTPGAAVAAGDVVVQGDLIGVANADIPANTLGALAVEGVFDFPKATGVGTAISVGSIVYWDAGAQQATTSGGAGTSKELGKTSVRASSSPSARGFLVLHPDRHQDRRQRLVLYGHRSKSGSFVSRIFRVRRPVAQHLPHSGTCVLHREYLCARELIRRARRASCLKERRHELTPARYVDRTIVSLHLTGPRAVRSWRRSDFHLASTDTAAAKPGGKDAHREASGHHAGAQGLCG